MGQSIRSTLPTFDALTDTNLDHYSLYADVDNVLIKRFGTGQPTINDGSDLSIAHNLGYVPFFMSYYSPLANGVWTIFNNQYNAFSDIDACAIDTTNLNFHNAGGHSSGNIQPVYDIFYDDMSQTGSPSITQSKQAIKVTRPNKDISSTNPNDYIMHSDLNNFKILKEGTASKDLEGISSWAIAHGANVQAPYKYFVFIKSGIDGKTILIGGTAATKTYDEGTSFFGSTMDSTNITITFPNQVGSTPMTLKYYVYGSGKSSTINNSGRVISVTKAGSDVLTETNPDNFNFHSNYSTLKYFTSGSWDMGSISGTTVKTIAHNLGYVPFFVGFVIDLQGFFTNGYAIMPYFLSNSNIPNPNRNIASWMYADSTNIYLKTWYDIHATNSSHPIFFYKIFKNNLGL